MFLSKAVFRTAVLFVILCVAPSTPSSSFSSCPLACLCEGGPHINCSSLGLQEVPQHIPGTVESLNLSHNALRTLPPLWPGRGVWGLRYLWLDYNKMETLSLCTRRDRARLKTSSSSSSSSESCMSWAPALEQLSAVGNQIQRVPKGLGGSANLRVLQLSHNKISTLGLPDFKGCTHLRELHLQGNLISSIHPLAFKDLQELQVLDLRFNLLTTIPSPVYLSLLNLKTQVDLSNNRWACDCHLRGIRNRLMQIDLDQMSQSWRLVCSSPLQHAGQKLTELKDQDLTCPLLGHGHVEHFDEVAEEGTQILLPCGTKNQDCSQALWWTPQGQTTGTQHGLLLTDITERDAGLYVCVSGQQEEQVSVFDLHVDLYVEAAESRLKRAVEHAVSRTVEKDIKRNQVRAKTQREFDLAVGLSVFFTFIIAFIIGVLVRPCLDILWRKIKMRTRRGSSDPPSPQVVVTTQNPAMYDNEGFAMSDEPGQVRVGQRVTFSDDTQPIYDRPVDHNDDTSSESSVENEPMYENNAQNSVTVENLETQQQSRRGAAQEVPVDSVHTEQQGSEASGRNTDMEYEPIPDPEELRKDTSSISSASSSISDQDQEPPDSTYENIPTTIRKTKGGEPEVDRTLEQATNQQNSSSPKGKPVAVPVFTPEPFTDWATQLMEKGKDQTNPLDPELWNDSGESFSFTDGSERSSTRDKTHSQASTQPAVEPGVLPPEDSDDDDVALPKPLERQADVYEVIDEPIYEEVSRPSTSTDSVDSGDEPTEYTVNPDEEEEEDEEEEKKKTPDPTLTEYVIPLKSDASTGQDEFSGNRPRIDTILLEPEDIKFAVIHDSSDPGALDEDPFLSEEEPSHRIRPELPQRRHYPAQRDTFSSSEGEEEPKKYNVHPVYRKRPIIPSTSESYSERASLSSEDEESPRYRPQTSIKKGSDIESRPITIDTSSLNVTSDLPIKRHDRVLNIDFDSSATNTDDLEIANRSGPQIETTMRGVSLDQVPLPKRALIFGIKNTGDPKQVPLTEQKQPSSLPGAVVGPGLIGSQLSSHSRPSVSSESSDENDLSATNTDYLNITNRNNSLSEARRLAPSPPPFRMEGTMERISLDQIPYPKRVLVFGIKNTGKDKEMPDINQRQPSLNSLSGAVVRPGLTGSQVSSQLRPRLSSQSSVSSDENDNTATITEITGKSTSVSGPPKHPPPPPPSVSMDQRQTSEFRPRVSSMSSVSSDENDFSATKTDIGDKNNSLSGSRRRAPSPPPFRMEGTMERISLDNIPYPKRALIFGVRNSLGHMQVTVANQRQPSQSSLSKVLVRPGLIASQVSSHSRPSVSSQSSVSSDENDFSATNRDIVDKTSSLSGSRRLAPSPPPFRMEGTMERISLDNIPSPKRHLVFGIKNSEDHKDVPVSSTSGSVVRPGLTGQSRPRLSSQSSVSSDENDHSATITEIAGKNSTVSRPPKYAAPPPPIKIEGTMGGVSLDEIPLPKRRLAFGLKNSEDHKEAPQTDQRQSSLSSITGSVARPGGLTSQSRPRLSSQSSVSSDENDNSSTMTEITSKNSALSRPQKYAAPPPPIKIEGTMGGVSSEEIPLPKRRLAFGIKNTEDYKGISQKDQRQPSLSSLSAAVVRPGLTSQSRPRLSSQSSVSSDENDNTATITGKNSSGSGPPNYAPPAPPVKMEAMGGVSLDQIPRPKRSLVFGIKNAEDHKEISLADQRQSSLSSISGSVVRPGITGQSRPRLSSQSSVSSDENDNSATIIDRSNKKHESLGQSPTTSQSQREGAIMGDQIPILKRRLAFGIKNSDDHKEVSSTSGSVVKSGLVQVSSQSRPRLSSESSVSSDENDNTATITGKNSSGTGPPKYAPPAPPVKMEAMGGVSLDQIPRPKRGLVFGIKNAEDHKEIPLADQRLSSLSSISGSVVRPGITGQSRPRLSSQSSVSSDENDNSATIIDKSNKKHESLGQSPTTSQSQREGAIMGDQIPILKRRLAFGIKNTDDHKDVPVSSTSGSVVRPGLTGQSRPRLSSQSSVSSDESDNTATNTKITANYSNVSGPPKYAPPAPPVKMEGMGGVSLEQIPRPKRGLVFGIKNTEDHKEIPLADQRQSSLSSISGSVVRPGITGQSRPRLSSQSSVSSDESDNTATNTKITANNSNVSGPPKYAPPAPPVKMEGMGGVSLEQIPRPKRGLVFGIKTTEDHKDIPEGSRYESVVRPGLTGSHQSRPSLSSQRSVNSDENSNSAIVTDITGKNSSVSHPPKYAPPAPQAKLEGSMSGVSLDEIPMPKRRLAFGIKNSEDHKEVPVSSTSKSIRPGLTSRPIERRSSESSVSSDENDNTATITELKGKNNSSPPKYAPPAPPVKMEGAMGGVSVDELPFPKRRLVFGIKNTEDHKEAPVRSVLGSVARQGLASQTKPQLSSQSSVSSDENDNSAANTDRSDLFRPPGHPPPSTPSQTGRMIKDQFSLPKRALIFGVRDSVDHKNVPEMDQTDSSPSSSSRVVASDMTSDSQPSLNAQLVKKRPLLVIKSEDTRVVQMNNAPNQSGQVSSQSSESSDENDTEKQMNISTDRFPQYKRRSLLTSPIDDSLGQRQITTTTTTKIIQRETNVPNLNASYKASISDATVMKREQPLKQGINHTESVSSISLRDSASSGGNSYKGHNSFAFDPLPKPQKSTLGAASSFSEMVQRRTVNDLSPNPATSFRPGQAIPYHSDHTFRSVTTRNAVITTTMSSKVSDMPRSGLEDGDEMLI